VTVKGKPNPNQGENHKPEPETEPEPKPNQAAKALLTLITFASQILRAHDEATRICSSYDNFPWPELPPQQDRYREKN